MPNTNTLRELHLGHSPVICADNLTSKYLDLRYAGCGMEIFPQVVANTQAYQPFAAFARYPGIVEFVGHVWPNLRVLCHIYDTLESFAKYPIQILLSILHTITAATSSVENDHEVCDCGYSRIAVGPWCCSAVESWRRSVPRLSSVRSLSVKAKVGVL